MSTSKIAYVELPAQSTEAMKRFYGGLFGWSFQDWGPEYAAFAEAGVDGGFHAGSEGRPKAPLVIVQTDDVLAMEARVREAGGTVTEPTFAFPGGRRFHFVDPSGNELGVMQLD